MNIEDIGQVEMLFGSWALIFHVIGKHKYASTMVSHIMNIFFHYSEGLKHAIQYSILINLKEKPDTF
ncbi:hypothetical protein C8Q75DRAFT_864275 [Abortiporus biennis]|nr:hypothetical protein C8Q75DRAFT_864275 [Abortiporus biennis]